MSVWFSFGVAAFGFICDEIDSAGRGLPAEVMGADMWSL
jgi:hypothetical protein